MLTLASKSRKQYSTLWDTLLVEYFYSGWAFLIPYLVSYLLYAWLKWPINPPQIGNEIQGVARWLPCLLHVYWFLHAFHLAFVTLALRARWRESHIETDSDSLLATAQRLQSIVYRLLPWIFLGLLFYIPGVYLEWPSDPWEHLKRINEWSSLDTVSRHYTWAKSSYFFGYSLIGHITPPLRQLQWFDSYYASCCLLLCWQYYRLARAVGLGGSASFIFVLIQALTLGNNIFGFYRYYGMSSTVFAQLGAVALTRMTLEALRPRETENRNPETRTQPTVFRSLFPALWRPLGATLLLTPFIAFNHAQGLAIAGLGIIAVVVWRLIVWRQSTIPWLVLTAVILSLAAIIWLLRDPALDEIYLPQRWLTPWYGFNLFSPGSPAGERTLQLLGVFGVVNLCAGVLLLRKNHIVGWLTVMPVLALCLPFIAIPFAGSLAQQFDGGGSIILFHRMFLGIPAGLALVVLGHRFFLTASPQDPASIFRPAPSRGGYLFYSIIMGLAAAAVVPAAGPFYNRMWNTLMSVPQDLRMSHILAALDRPSIKAHQPVLMASRGVGFIVSASGERNIGDFLGQRFIIPSTGKSRESLPFMPAYEREALADHMRRFIESKTYTKLMIPSANFLQSPASQSAYLSMHWLPQQVSLEHIAAPELGITAQKLGGTLIIDGGFRYYVFLNPSLK